MSEPSPGIRIDKWLWYARFFKTRSLAAKVVSGGHVRLNGARISKPSMMVRPGDGLTFAQGDDIRVVRLLEIGNRRGPAPEAQALYEDLAPPKAPSKNRELKSDPVRIDGEGRPTKKDRRNWEKLSDRGS